MKKITNLIIVFLLTIACQHNSLKIVNHDIPNIQSDFSPFQNIGCDKPDGRPNWYRCEEENLLKDFGCNIIENKPLLGGISPNYPIAICIIEIKQEFVFADIPDNECFYANGFMITYCYRYLVYKDGGFQLIKTMDEFRSVFAPVDSKDEALSFVLSTGKYTALYNQIKNEDNNYLVISIEDTYVEFVLDEYIVNVFYTAPFGCGNFITNSVEARVTKDGYINIVNFYPIYETKEVICVE